MSKNFFILSGFAAASLCLPFAQQSRAQTLLPTLQSVTCTNAAVTAPSAISVDVYDGTTSTPIASNVAITAGYLPTNIPLGSMPTAGPYHVISVSVHGTTQDIAGSPQSMTCGSQATYAYTSSFTFPSSFTPSSLWAAANGSYTTQSGVLSTVGSSPFSLVYTGSGSSGPLPNPLNSSEWSNEYEINSTLQLTSSGGSYFHYLMAQTKAEQGTSGAASNSQKYYAVELANPTFDSGGNCTATLNFWQNTTGSSTATRISTIAVACSSTTSMRSVTFYLQGSGVWKTWVLINNYLYSYTLSAPGTQFPLGSTSIYPGIGANQLPNTSSGFSQASFGPRSLISAAPVVATTVATAVFPNEVDISWNPPANTSGVNSIQSWFDRITSGTSDNNSGQAYLGSTYTDTIAVQPNTTYTYEEQERSFHGLFSSQTSFGVITPAASGVDPHRTGLRPTGAYWGAMGEQIDVLSGNLNFGLPLLNAQGRNGKSVPFRLAYNSQNWRQDQNAQYVSDYTWNLGEDIGYGYGWALQLGSLTPYYNNSSSNSIDHYLYIDSTGAEYRLNVDVGNIYSSQEGIYVWYDSIAKLLHFKDGSSWLMGCVSGGLEVDLGTMYPTEITDANGNQFLIRYMTGFDAIFSNSSGRISEVEDVRAVYNSGTNTRRTYYFTYSQLSGDPIAMHLTGINNTVGTNETYTFAFNGNSNPTPFTLADPFQSNPIYGPFYNLTGMAMPNSSLFYAMSYDTANSIGSGTLTQVTLPFQGTLKWGYQNFSYINPYLNQMEVNSRTINDGYSGTPYTYSFAPTGNSQVHSQVVLSDPHGDSETWLFNTSPLTVGGAAGPVTSVGLLSGTTTTSASGGTPASTSVTWTTANGSAPPVTATLEDPYVGAVSSTRYGATASEAITKDGSGYGNTTQVVATDYSGSTRTYAYTYNTSPSYTSAYLRSLPLTGTIQVGSGTAITLFTNSYDQTSLSLLSAGTTEYVQSYNTTGAHQIRGNLTQKVTGGVTTAYTYNAAGTQTSASNGTSTVNSSISSATNYTAPDLINLGGNANLQTSFAYTPFLGVGTSTDNGNGGAASYTYDTAGRIQTATSVDGAVTTYAYAISAPFTQRATVTTSNNAQGRYTTTTFDGFGRTRTVVRTDANGVQQSEVDTTYGPSSNAPLGLKTSGTLPYKPGATTYTSTTVYDGAGNPLKQTLPDGSATTYFYNGNNTTTADPAGNWKTVTADIFGNTTALTEPDPTNSGATYLTSYTYDWVNHLTAVSMGTRDGQQQTPCGGYARTFTYSSTTLQLMSKCEPETGTTSYTYNADGTINQKIFGNGKTVTYNYDTYGRNTGFSGSSGDGEIVGWDTIPLGGFSSYGTNAYGRVAYREQKNCAGLAPFACVEAYNYTQSGHVTGEQLAAYNTSGFTVAPALTASFAYDNEGRMTSITYPPIPGSSAVTYTYGFDALGRPTGMSTVATAGAYNASDQLTALSYLGGTETRNYNSLNQLTGILLGSTVNQSYFYNAGYNNGQIATSVDSVHGQTVAYSYDALKRLSAAYYTNLGLVDPGLEQTTVNGWVVSGDASWTDVQAKSWPYSMAAWGGNATQSGVCAAGAIYTASGYYMTAPGVSATVTMSGAATTAQTLAPATGWTAFSFAFTGPASCPGAVAITLGGGEAGGAVYFDDVALTSPSVSSGANELVNPGFTDLTVAWQSGGGGPLLTQTTSHSGKTSLLLPTGSWLGQVVTGLTPNVGYTLSAYLNGGQGTLTAGSSSTTATASSGWTEVQVTGQASASGTLAMTAVSSGSGTVEWDDFSIANSAVSGGQQFGYDGFGNLLSQTPISGSAPMMNLTVNPNTNQVTSGGAVYDGAGNMTSNGSMSFAYDEMNRLISAGSVTYSYSPGENRRMVTSVTIGGQQTANLFLYGPNGKLMSVFGYQKNGSAWMPTGGGQRNLFYLGSKALSYAENNIGSTTASTFWPYGQVNTSGMGVGGFATYWNDSSGFYYADQRYYNQNWGRFVTADPSNANIDSTVSGSFNRFAYVNEDPMNGMDPSGLDDADDDAGQICIDPNSDCGGINPGGSGDGGGQGGGDTGVGDGGGDPPAIEGTAVDPIGTDPSITGSSDPSQQITNLPGSDPDSLTPVPSPGDSTCGCVPFPTIDWTKVWIDIRPGGQAVGIALPLLWDLLSKRLVVAQASCYVHPVGDPNHSGLPKVTAEGVGVTYGLAKGNAFVNAQAKVSKAYGVGYHAQHCSYKRIR